MYERVSGWKIINKSILRGSVNSSNNSDVNHSQQPSSAPMDLSLSASNDNGPSDRQDGGGSDVVEDLSLPTSRHNAAFSNLSSTKGKLFIVLLELKVYLD